MELMGFTKSVDTILLFGFVEPACIWSGSNLG